jgi:hypothetical protein
MDQQSVPEGKDAQLWQLAQRRAAFKRHLATYLVINAFLWVIWFFTEGDRHRGGIPWPAWTTAGWGVGLFFQYINAYVSTGQGSVEKEYDQLKKNSYKNQ